MATGKAQSLYLKSDPNFISPAKDADTSAYTPLQQKAAELVANAKNFSQLLNRDTRPDSASTVMIPALKSFIRNPQRRGQHPQEDRRAEEGDLPVLARPV